MINDNELLISNKSYVNKDFASIYPELLDIIKKITNKWDPESTNESDPGIVLTKIAAFIGDKLNYNIDKNVLECFMTSATQDSSMRKLCEMLGYNMGYYHSAETDVTFTYTGNKLKNDGTTSFTLPALETVISSNDDSGITFVLTEDVTINEKNVPITKSALQGTIEKLSIGDSDTIQLSNMDDNNRIYFPISMIAENGIFISNINSKKYWRLVDNLNTQLPNERVFKFGYDSSKKVPYVEFPKDISNIIGSGLNIKYLITNGEDGNIKSKFLNKLLSPVSNIKINGSNDETISFDSEEGNSDLIIKNSSASINGKNPETIDEAYNNFKKTIGTFDTLVTCRDYANAIYNMYDANGNFPLVSNAQATDRRDDLNYSSRILSFSSYGPKFINGNQNLITPYDICLYPLNPINTYTLKGFNNSFKALQNIIPIENGLEYSKSISHNFKHDSFTNNDIYTIKNYYKLDAKISTTYKVNDFERLSIISNIQTALIKKFNAREIDYGYEIPYEAILKTIEESDNRISSVSLSEPELSTRFLTKDNTEYPLYSFDKQLTSGKDFYINILTKNILEGKISLFNFDNDFKYDFGQSKISTNPMILPNIKTIKTNANINLEKNVEYGPLQKNEVIQLVAPSIVTEITYPAYVYYHCVLNGNKTILKNTDYKLGANEVLIFVYKDSDDNQVVEKYSEGDIIKPNFDLKSTKDVLASGKTPFPKEIDNATLDSLDIRKYLSTDPRYNGKLITYSLGVKEQIEKRRLNKVTLNSRTPCYWIRNNGANKLFSDSELDLNTNKYTTMLGDNEYLFYTDLGFNDLVTVGSGTIIECANIQSDWTADLVDSEEILKEGLLSLKSKWKYLNLNSENTLEIFETSILTLTEGDKVKTSEANDLRTTSSMSSNKLRPLKGTLTYTIDDETKQLENIYLDGKNSWNIRTRLDINSSKDVSQTLLKGHKIIFTNKDSNSLELSEGNTFNLNNIYQLIGSDDIDMTSYKLNKNYTKEEIFPTSVYTYNITATPELLINEQGYKFIYYDSLKQKDYIFNTPSLTKKGILMIYWKPYNDSVGKLNLKSTGIKLKLFNTSSEYSNSLDLVEGINVIDLNNEIENMTLTSSEGLVKGDIIMSKLDFYKGLNPNLGFESFIKNVPEVTEQLLKEELLNKLKEQGSVEGVNKFYYNNKVENSKIIETTDMSSPYSFYDYNNVTNKMTLSELDFETSIIDIVRSSRL